MRTYADKTGRDIADLSKMVEAETWLSAEEALSLGFADEISGAVEIEVDDAEKLLIFNSLAVNKNYYTKAKEKIKMEQNSKSILEKIRNILVGDTDEESGIRNQESGIENKVTAEAVRKQEIERIKNLNAMRCGNANIDAVIDIAIADGEEVSQVGKYVDALKKVSRETKATAQKFLDMLEDNLKSGAEGVAGSSGEVEDKRKEQADLIAKFANLDR